MGADIHAYIEYRPRTPQGAEWASFNDGEIWIGRSYKLFHALAGVRKRENATSELIPPRGIPDDLGPAAFRTLYFPVFSQTEIVDDGPLIVTPFAIREGLPPETRLVSIRGGDYFLDEYAHSHSWLSFEEIHLAITHLGIRAEEELEVEFHAAMSAMRTLESRYETRLVFWFDS